MNLKNLFFLLFILLSWSTLAQNTPYFTNGLKVGEVTTNSVVLWSRLCKFPQPIKVSHQRKDAPFKSPIAFDDDIPVEKMDGAVEGTEGYLRFTINSENFSLNTDWVKIDSSTDYTQKVLIENLRPNQKYKVIVEGKLHTSGMTNQFKGSFKTAPEDQMPSPVKFTVSTCQYFWDFDDKERGFKIYDAMNELNPDFFIQNGDYVYYDKPGPLAKSPKKARHKWHAINGWPSLVDFFSKVPVLMQKDDHDLLMDDYDPSKTHYGKLSAITAQKIWQEEPPIIEKPYRRIRWGKDLEIWLVEGRDYRSKNSQADNEDKSIWGKEQKNWFIKTVTESDAKLKILSSPTPVIGPDRKTGKNDNHSNDAYRTEGKWLRNFLNNNHMLVICGDRHWQYVSKDPETALMEFSVGPASNAHAQGWNPDDFLPQHEFLRVEGGFLSAELKYENNIPKLILKHHDVDGNIVNEVQIED
ncbi:alkaline phosphatase D family protein [Echinicola shivajiensis]|uniref:alkaline phosphatase D family protein n=1 Tax=Echinicola shivajiensis TaxID=1035916 RepID=UPI001BFCBF22|nr:alkaline phosphatase D family protein [Echinicola shivajiensis]